MNAIMNLDNKLFKFEDYAVKKAVVQLEYPEIINDRSIGDKFMEVLEKGSIRTLFQPIISLKDGQIFGVEALSRGPKDTVLENPGVLFDFARVHGKLWELEFLCRIKALEKASKGLKNINIFINVDPDIINDDKFTKGFTKEFLNKFGLNPENIVFEITEKNNVSDINSFKKLINHYKEQGYKIAIDDTGSGYSGLKLITDLNPHFIKLDMSLIRDIDKDGVKYALVKTLNEFCLVTNIKVIAEGIETENELNSLIDIGIEYGQGFFLHRPTENNLDIKQEVTELIQSRNNKKRKLYHCKPNTVFVGDICRNSICVDSSYTGGKVLEIFNSNPTIMGMPVVDHDKITGLIMKERFFEKLGTQYGFSLFFNRPINLVMDKRPLCIQYETTIDIASKLAMNRNIENTYDYVIVEKDSKYYGIVTIKDLLEKAIELEVNYAKHLNPLSGLPGNVLIEQKLKEIISNSGNYTVLYIDIDNFKVYNDVYGFEKGDAMIQFVSRIINEAVIMGDFNESFVGHVGGDDFIIVLEDYNVESLCEKILQDFKHGVSNFYNDEHIQNQYIYAKNRYGCEEKFNLVTLSIAGVSNKLNIYEDVYQLTSFASKIKKLCKENWDNCYILK
jgi:diguanylate cyclase (GGDEF) domain